ncbi:MAG: DnaD domain protein, partial [Oscillospiraceae bacterium]|nr:DnaD domain protein [Oscillospiraceae bacterium]
MSERAEKNYISDEVLDALIAAHDGDMALLYLYRLRGGPADRENAARALCRTLQDVGSAEEKLERLDLLGKGGSPAPSASPAPKGSAPARSAVAERLSPAQELPEYTAEEISRRSRENSALSSIYQEAARVMGRTLSGNDLRVLFGIYDHLGLPPEVILELLHWCDELCQLRYKDHRKPSSLFLQKEAYAWADREIMTLEQAEEHIRAQRQRRSDLGRIQSALHLDLLSPTQKTDICLWLDQGFDEEGI